MIDQLQTQRREESEVYDAALLDWLCLELDCSHCSQLSLSSTIVVADIGYDDFKSLRSFVPFLIPQILGDEPQDSHCQHCQQTAEVEAIYYFSYHATISKDLMVKARAAEDPGKVTAEVFWSQAGDELVAVDALNATEALGLELSLLVRKTEVEAMSGSPDDDAIVEAAELAHLQAPGHPLLLEILGALVNWGRTTMALKIATSRIEAAPNDPRGHYWRGETLFKTVNHGVLGKEHIEEAMQYLTRAIELDPTSVPPRNSLANCLRLLGKNHQARLWYTDLIQEDEHCPEARFNLGILDLETGDPEAALHHFIAGEQGDGDDPDFPMGRARALLALGRMSDARDALDRMRELDPSHPKLADLEARAGNSRP